MSTPISDYNYHLPSEFIAQEPVEPRDQSKLLVLGSKDDVMQHKRFFEIGQFLRDNDVLVFNDTKVFKARLVGKVLRASEVVEVEVFLLRAHDQVWEAMVRPGKKVELGAEICFENKLSCHVLEKQ